jgi:hypothetical protein
MIQRLKSRLINSQTSRQSTLAEEAIDTSRNTDLYLPNLGFFSWVVVSTRLKLRGSCDLILEDELHSIYLNAFSHPLNGLISCAAFWGSLTVAKAALENFSRNADILEMRDSMKESFTDRHNGQTSLGTTNKDLVALSRSGNIYQKKCP